jgi:hypothetical protein
MAWKERLARTSDNWHDAMLNTRQFTMRLFAILVSMALAVSLPSHAIAEEAPEIHVCFLFGSF